MVKCAEPFFICNTCGYAKNINEVEQNSGYLTYKDEEKHNGIRGSECDSKKLYKYWLTHTFKTDVAQIIFDKKYSSDYSAMISVMYALLNGISKVLDIERGDIDGCLRNIKGSYSIIIYDSVHGGAGHIKRIININILNEIINEAINSLENCACVPSCYKCLRNYFNQKIHDRLDRKKSLEFLRCFK